MIDRRSFLRGSFAAVGVGAVAPSWLTRRARGEDAASPQAPAPDEKILVVVEMGGGNDGLNTVVPWADDLYQKARPTLRFAESDVLKLDDHVGLHPSLAPLHRRFQNGEVAVVQGVGYPNPDRSHFRSMEIWHTGEPGSGPVKNGWLGRAADALDPNDASAALLVTLGSALPLAVKRERAPVLSFDREGEYNLSPDSKHPDDGAAQVAAFRKMCGAHGAAESPLVATVRRTAAAGITTADELESCLAKAKSNVTYTAGFGARLGLVARMIAGGMKTRVYYVSIGGFDTHVKQRDGHATQLSTLAKGIDAFFEDLAAFGRAKDVLLFTFSEFGRRLAENASAGTDHGTAGPMLVVSPSIHGTPGMHGGVIGESPNLADLVDGDPKFTIDFRSVYATVLASWLKVPAPAVLGAAFPRLPLFTADV